MPVLTHIINLKLTADKLQEIFCI